MKARIAAKIRAWAERHRPQLVGLMIGSWVTLIASVVAIWSTRGCK